MMASGGVETYSWLANPNVATSVPSIKRSESTRKGISFLMLVSNLSYSETFCVLQPENTTIDNAAATFTYSGGEGFSVNGTVEVLPADDPDYPNKMYFHSDDVDAFPRYMYDNRGDAHRAKYII